MKKSLLISSLVLLFINIFLILWVVDFFFHTSILNPFLPKYQLRFFHAVFILAPLIIFEIILISYYKFSKIKVDKLFILNIVLTLLVSIVFIYFGSIFFQF
jgi:hypothetical protein